jgi:hypothetical protein
MKCRGERVFREKLSDFKGKNAISEGGCQARSRWMCHDSVDDEFRRMSNFVLIVNFQQA